jgi:hypothetical protein
MANRNLVRTRKLVRRGPGTPARIARRTPQLTRVKGPPDLQAPVGYTASVIVKLVRRKGNSPTDNLWLLVDEFAEDSITFPSIFTIVSAIRCDIPTGKPLSPTALQPHLHKFLKAEGNSPHHPPTIVRFDPDPPVVKVKILRLDPDPPKTPRA